MSSYRDDTQENVFIHETTWMDVSAVVEEQVDASGSLTFRVTVLVPDVVAASDAVTESTIAYIAESASATDQLSGLRTVAATTLDSVKIADTILSRITQLVTDVLASSDLVSDVLRGAPINEIVAVGGEAVDIGRVASQLVLESLKASDNVVNTIQNEVSESVATGDAVSDKTLALTVESASTAGDAVLNQKIATTLVAESALAGSSSIDLFSSQIVDSVQAADATSGSLHAVVSVLDSVTVADFLSNGIAVADLLIEAVVSGDATTGTNKAFTLVSEGKSVLDQVIQIGIVLPGQVWTALSSTNAMSRYDFGLEQLTFINGQLYGFGQDGVYDMQSDGEEISASVETALLDMTDGNLGHPVEAYLAYQANADVSMTVTQTQSGAGESYQYALPSELSDVMTNGRVQFGRGLRGRHFKFLLSMNGTRASVDTLDVEVTKSNRRT